MNLIKASLERPIAIVSVIIMTVILGFVALDRIPIQIAPDVNKPIISITTYWYGASPSSIYNSSITPLKVAFTLDFSILSLAILSRL